jgi:hypothetical protein
MIVGTQNPNFLCGFPFFMQHVGEVLTSKHVGYRHQSVKKHIWQHPTKKPCEANNIQLTKKPIVTKNGAAKRARSI